MKEKNNYVLATFGAFIGACIATIPWILVYIYGNMMFSALAIIIAFVALKGYQLFKGKQTKYLPIIITVVSLLSVSIATLLVIPLALLSKQGYDASFYNLNLLYHSSEFCSAIFRDFAISILFTVLGISGIVKSLKQQVISKDEEDIEEAEVEEVKKSKKKSTEDK